MEAVSSYSNAAAAVIEDSTGLRVAPMIIASTSFAVAMLFSGSISRVGYVLRNIGYICRVSHTHLQHLCWGLPFVMCRCACLPLRHKHNGDLRELRTSISNFDCPRPVSHLLTQAILAALEVNLDYAVNVTLLTFNTIICLRSLMNDDVPQEEQVVPSMMSFFGKNKAFKDGKIKDAGKTRLFWLHFSMDRYLIYFSVWLL